MKQVTVQYKEGKVTYTITNELDLSFQFIKLVLMDGEVKFINRDAAEVITVAVVSPVKKICLNVDAEVMLEESAIDVHSSLGAYCGSFVVPRDEAKVLVDVININSKSYKAVLRK